MPILDKMNQNNMPDDNNGNNKRPNLADLPVEEPKRKRPLPKLLDSRMGRRKISLAALIERIADQFREENTPDDSAVRAAKTRADRAKLLRPVVEYVLNTESVNLENDEQKAEILRRAYSAIFGFGPLDDFIADKAITTITIEGANQVSVRRGHDDLEPVDLIFEDADHLKIIAQRILKRAGADLRDDMPIVEAGLQADNGRFVSVSMVAPPITYTLNLDIRLHPAQPPTLETLVERGTLTDKAAQLLRALVQSDYGFTLVGQPESGKTMTLAALLAELPNPAQAVAIERTGELHLPEGMSRAVTQWPNDDEGVTFGEQIQAHSRGDYRVIVLDEVRADEPHTIAPLLAMDNPPRLIWSFRGTPTTKRLSSALGMLARRADESQGDELAQTLFERLPFVITVRRAQGKIQLGEIGEWQTNADSVSYRTVLRITEDETISNTPSRALPGLDAAFYNSLSSPADSNT